MSYTRFIGIDPGLEGALACVDMDGGYQAFDMPVYIKKQGKKTSRMLDEVGFVQLLDSITLKDVSGHEAQGSGQRPSASTMVFLERQQAYHKQGVVSTFRTGAGYGYLRGVLRALGVPFEDEFPKKWQAEFGIVQVNDTKLASYQQASSLFPRLEFKTQRGRIKDGWSDAILMAEYLRRRYR